MWVCNNINCNRENLDEDVFCVDCGTPKPAASNNHCSNPNCQYHDVILEDLEQKYCGKCGAATTYWKQIESMC